MDSSASTAKTVNGGKNYNFALTVLTSLFFFGAL
jgi:hypothetical protein